MREKARQIKEREREMREERKAELEVRVGGDLNLIRVIPSLRTSYGAGGRLRTSHRT